MLGTHGLSLAFLLSRRPPPAGARVRQVTICAYAEDEVVRLVSQENHEIYAKLHGSAAGRARLLGEGSGRLGFVKYLL